eukprot:m.133496 g.133496  ORF g.133496 m.133496 type:complete len:125 (+) comp13838_c0_seq3:2556-2930(+)
MTCSARLTLPKEPVPSVSPREYCPIFFTPAPAIPAADCPHGHGEVGSTNFFQCSTKAGDTAAFKSSCSQHDQLNCCEPMRFALLTREPRAQKARCTTSSPTSTFFELNLDNLEPQMTSPRSVRA